MLSRSAMSKLKAILMIDVLIVAIAAGIYLYLQNTGQLAAESQSTEFTVTDLTINPLEAEIGESITISANLTNVGQIEGSYTLNLTINDILKGNQTILLSPGESRILEFTDAENTEGNYTVKIGTLTGSFIIKPPPPTTSNIILSDLLVTPYEANVGSTVNIKVTARNPGTEADSILIKVSIDSELADSKTVQLAGGATETIEFTINATSEGRHRVNVNTLSGSFMVVPEGMHTLTILISPVPKGGSGDFHLNGEAQRTPYSALLPEGTYTVAMPATDPTGEYGFLNWNDGELNPVRTISLTEAMLLVAYFEFATSCPSLYLWNGEEWVYIQEVSNHGWLGYTRYVNEDGSLEYWRNNPWDYIPLDKTQLQLTGGYYRINLTQRWNEIFFLDKTNLMVVDHPSNTNVYSTMVEQYIDPNYMGQIYTVSKDPLKPVSATNELVTVYNGVVVDSYNKVDALSEISSKDGVFTSGFNGKYSEDWNNQTWNRLTLDLGDLTGAPQIKLIVKAMVNWGETDSYVLWMNKFYSTQVPNHTEPTPTPFMEVKDANGNWMRVPENRQFPLPPDLPPSDELARTFVIDLTGLFSTNDYSLRISNFWNVTFDFIGVDTSVQKDVTIERIDPTASLHQEFYSPSTSSGSFTRYGDVTSLLLAEDDEFVIGRQGDSVSLLFPADDLPPVAAGMERDFFFFVACWFKVQYANYGFGPGHDGFTVDPLPFHNMSGFPYPLATESYPYDDAHNAYLRDYNTRVIDASSEAASFSIWIPIVAAVSIVVANVAILVRFRKRKR